MASVIMYKNFGTIQLVPSSVFQMKDKNGVLGRKMVFLQYGTSKTVLVQTPVMDVPFGVSEYTAENMPVKYSLDVSFQGYATDNKLKRFYDVVSELDEYLVQMGVKHSEEWFGKAHSEDMIREFYRPLINVGKDAAKYAPRIKMKIAPSRDENEINVDAYTSDRQKFDMKEFQPGSKVKIIYELSPIWFIGKTQYGVSLKIVQMEVVKGPERLKSFAFQNDSDDEDVSGGISDMVNKQYDFDDSDL